jgi:hypothetical protein
VFAAAFRCTFPVAEYGLVTDSTPGCFATSNNIAEARDFTSAESTGTPVVRHTMVPLVVTTLDPDCSPNSAYAVEDSLFGNVAESVNELPAPNAPAASPASTTAQPITIPNRHLAHHHPNAFTGNTSRESENNLDQHFENPTPSRQPTAVTVDTAPAVSGENVRIAW